MKKGGDDADEYKRPYVTTRVDARHEEVMAALRALAESTSNEFKAVRKTLGSLKRTLEDLDDIQQELRDAIIVARTNSTIKKLTRESVEQQDPPPQPE